MTVAELIRALEKINDKSLEVVADIGLDFCDRPTTELITGVEETREYYGTVENGGWCARTRECVKIY